MSTYFKSVTAMILLVLSQSGFAEKGPTAIEAELTRISNAWDKAIVQKDKVAIAANMAEDFRQIDSRGHYETKASFVESIVDPKSTIDPYHVEEFEIRLYGDVALLSGRIQMTGSYDGKAWKSDFRYIDIYHRKNGQWKIVSVQTTRVEGD